jgi:hypothetical protein
MTALTANRPTEFLENGRVWRTFPVAEDAVIFAGALVGVNTDGFLVPASPIPTLKIVGIACTEQDADGLASGDLEVEVDANICLLANGSSSITANDVESLCYALDDQTVTLSDGGVAQITVATVVYDAGAATGFTITGVPLISVTAATSATATALALTNAANARADFAALYTAVALNATVTITKKTAGLFTLTKVVGGAADITQATDPVGVAATRPVAGTIHQVDSRGVYVRVIG